MTKYDVKDCVPKTISDWSLPKRYKNIVRNELVQWLQHFLNLTDGEGGNVRKNNFFDELGVFFFTDCKDILSVDPESTGIESNMTIRRRKRFIYMQLFLRFLLEQKDHIIIDNCSHCGFVGTEIVVLDDNGSYMHFCPHCKDMVINTFPQLWKTMCGGFVEWVKQFEE